MPGRKFSAGNVYRYGFNGKEKDKDISEGGQDYGKRISESRLGRFLSVDPLASKFPMLTPYQFASNRPIAMIDLDGLEGSMSISGANMVSPLFQHVEFDVDGDKIPDYNAGWAAGLYITAQMGFTVLSGRMGGPGSTLLVNIVRGGATGAVVNMAMSYAQGEKGYELVKSGVSGFFSGAVLGGFSKITSLGGLFAVGAGSGATGEFVNQTFDNTFGNGNGSYDLNKILTSAGIGGVANIISSKIIDYAHGLIDKKAAEYVTLTQSKVYRETIKNAIKEETPRITPGVLKREVNKRIREIQQLIRKQAEVEKQAATQAIERAVDYLQDKTNK